MNMKKILALVLALVMVLALVACGAEKAPAEEETADKLKVALVLPGKKDDVSFNQAMYRGMNDYFNAHSEEIELTVVENIYDVADITPALTEYADTGYDVVIGHGYQFSEPVVTVAGQYPEVAFLLGCGVIDPVVNASQYDVQLEAGGYLMGVIAALTTQSNQIGVIGGGEGAEITRGHEGFKMGEIGRAHV